MSQNFFLMLLFKELENCLFLLLATRIMVLRTLEETVIQISMSFKYKSSVTGKTSNANQQNGENTEQGNTKTKKILKLYFH